MKKNAPCRNCAERHDVCHDTCDKYKKWRDDLHEHKRKLKEDLQELAEYKRTIRGVT